MTTRDSSMAQQPIIILGAGIAGLTLSSCLGAKGIGSTIYERATSSPRHNYGITLHDWAYNPLLKILDLEEHDLRRRTAVDSFRQSGIGQVHPDESTVRFGQNSPKSFRANRSKLEMLLREGQDIRWQHDLIDLKKLPGGGAMKLTFQDGLQVTSPFIIDTLGVHSQVRKLMLPDHDIRVLPFVVFNGKRVISHDQFLKTYTPHFKSGNMLALKLKQENGSVLLQVDINNYMPSGDVSISYLYSRPSKSSPEQDLLHNPHRPLPGARSISPAFFSELHQLFLSTTKPPSLMPDPFLSTFRPTEVQLDEKDGRLLHWLMRLLPARNAADLLTLSQDSGIVMIGDSAHATPILGGDGANHAMKDAAELAKMMAAQISGDAGSRLDTAVVAAKFYEMCAGRWTDEVRDSEERIAKMHQPLPRQGEIEEKAKRGARTSSLL